MNSHSISDLVTVPPKLQAEQVRVAVICDFAEENWPSMDLVGDMLFAHLQIGFNDGFAPRQIRPRLPRIVGSNPTKPNRFLGRFLAYPRELRSIRDQFDLFHIVDHSYAHLVHYLPANRTVVTCHDLDTFRSLLLPAERRSLPFRAMTRRILTGMQRAAHVTCDTAATRDGILEHHLVANERLTVVHNGVHPLFRSTPDPASDNEISYRLGRAPGRCTELLHVGSTIPRKRIPDLLRIFKAVSEHRPDARLLRVGGAFTADQERLAHELGVRDRINVLEKLSSPLLAAVYRRSNLLLQPSDAEGFGLPLVEALASGTPVIASDIAALREIGGQAARYCPVGDIQEWTSTIFRSLAEPSDSSSLVVQAAKFSWDRYASQMVDIYNRVLA